MSIYDESAVKERYKKAPKDEQAINYLKALKVIVGSDGHVAEAEMDALKKGMNRMGASAELIKTIEGFDITNVKLEEVLPSLKSGGKRARYLLRDAVEISRADGTYATEEKAAVAKAAQLLGVAPDTVKSIEALVELEHAVKRLSKALFQT